MAATVSYMSGNRSKRFTFDGWNDFRSRVDTALRASPHATASPRAGGGFHLN
jgi:hypothetical protein